jgi:hypothetical protein
VRTVRVRLDKAGGEGGVLGAQRREVERLLEHRRVHAAVGELALRDERQEGAGRVAALRRAGCGREPRLDVRRERLLDGVRRRAGGLLAGHNLSHV